ncbi:MAG: MBL fold metallo-hydrolase, partial [Bacteroidaceae bacterium]|nr:MBL fold metallo-hydrolase [Bacteroidaceae bacterium]
AMQVLHTPGHTPGGVCYYIPQARIVITGDTLFRMGIGRTDLPGGDYRQELESIEDKIFTLPADTKVLPGHGPESTVGEEMSSNPYIP